MIEEIHTRLARWVLSLPEPLRPAGAGVAFVLGFMTMRGALFGIPLIAIWVLFRSATPARDLGVFAAALGLALAGGGLAGLVYGLLGRPARRIPVVGPYLAGIVSIAPYMALLVPITRLLGSKSIWAAPSTVDLAIFAFMSVFFGAVLGHSAFREGPEAAESDADGDA